ncbi:MAG: 2Fe-2S iron-sulfur cluster-binding protein [Gemmataceae bacterium]
MLAAAEEAKAPVGPAFPEAFEEGGLASCKQNSALKCPSFSPGDCSWMSGATWSSGSLNTTAPELRQKLTTAAATGRRQLLRAERRNPDAGLLVRCGGGCWCIVCRTPITGTDKLDRSRTASGTRSWSGVDVPDVPVDLPVGEAAHGRDRRRASLAAKGIEANSSR